MTTETCSTSPPGGWILQAGPFVILAATAAYLRARWDQIPARFPVHWGIDGRPNGFSVRTPMGVYGPLLLGAIVLMVIGVMNFAAMRLATTGTDRDSLAARLKHTMALRIGLFLAGLEFFLAATFSLVGLSPLTGAPSIHIVLAAAAIIIAAFAAIAWRIGQAQRRDQAILAVAEAHGVSPAHGSYDENWKMGVFYCNPNDPALWVAKRSGLGYTLNFAHHASWLVLTALLILPLGAAVFAAWRR